MPTWKVFRWDFPDQQNGRLLYEGPDEKRARGDFHNHTVNGGRRQALAVRLYCDGKCVDEVAVWSKGVRL